MPITTGSHLGPYEILGPLGAGGMGQVWKARDSRLDRVVAIKISEAKFSERFEREAEDRKLMAVSVSAGPSFGLPKPLFQTQVPITVNSNHMHYVPTRDGRRFLVNTQADSPPPPITVVLNWITDLKK